MKLRIALSSNVKVIMKSKWTLLVFMEFCSINKKNIDIYPCTSLFF